jgi:hypothetical protein
VSRAARHGQRPTDRPDLQPGQREDQPASALEGVRPVVAERGSTAPDIRRVAATNYEGFDLGPWRAYLAAFDHYLATGSQLARLTMRTELQDRLDERG